MVATPKFGSLQKSGDYDSVLEFLDYITGDEYLKNQTSQAGTPYDQIASSMTTPSSYVYDSASTPQDSSFLSNDASFLSNDASFLSNDASFLSNDASFTSSNDLYSNESFNPNDSPIYNTTILSSPSLDPALGFFPSLNIPWSTETAAAGFSSTETVHASSETVHASSSSPSILSSIPSSVANSPKTSSTVTSPSSTSPSTFKSNTRSRKRSIGESDKDPQAVADELALKRAKNTDAARRSRLRKVMKMETLEKQVTELKAENNDLQTRIAVLESEKKGLEDKNAEKDARVKMLEQQLAEAHERLVRHN